MLTLSNPFQFKIVSLSVPILHMSNNHSQVCNTCDTWRWWYEAIVVSTQAQTSCILYSDWVGKNLGEIWSLSWHGLCHPFHWRVYRWSAAEFQTTTKEQTKPTMGKKSAMIFSSALSVLRPTPPSRPGSRSCFQSPPPPSNFEEESPDDALKVEQLYDC